MLHIQYQTAQIHIKQVYICACVCSVFNDLDVSSILYSPIWTLGIWKDNSMSTIQKLDC